MKLIILQFLISAVASADVCDQWFKNSRVSPGDKDCLTKCVVLSVDMSTFNCHDACSVLCKKSAIPDFAFKLSSLYPGLTQPEKALCGEYPKEAIMVYINKEAAESFCQDLYGGNRTNDESDACRHFMWAGLNTKDLGNKLAKKFLDAHEEQPGQPEREKNMDLANNKSGIGNAEDLLRNNKFSTQELESRFKNTLKNGKLVVLKPRGTK